MKGLVILSLVALVAIVAAKPHAGRNNALLKEELRELIRQRLAAKLGVPSSHQSSDYARGKNYAGEAYDTGASGAQQAAAHDAGRQEFHNVGKHHSKVTKITQQESSESHDIGGSKVHDKSASAGGRFNKHANGAKNAANAYDEGQQQSDVIYP